LPTIKESVLSPAIKIKNVNLDEEQRKKLNLIYSKDYKIENDLEIIFKGLSLLGS